MSTNQKNRSRPEFMRNFTTKVKKRMILISNTSYCGNIDKQISYINQEVNKLVQELNLKIVDRQLPYISLRAKYDNRLDSKSRMFVHDYDTSNAIEKDFISEIKKHNDISHVLEFLIAPGFKEVKISELLCDAELVIDNDFLKCAAIDILLDIIMFNSYSFLKELNIKEKRKFSYKKFEFFKTKKLNCFYNCEENDSLYYSLAFSARIDKSNLDINRYMVLWQEFMDVYYPNCKHEEKTIEEQLKQHVDYGELPNDLINRFDKLGSGAYLILRTNKNRSEHISPWLLNYFNINEFKKGKILIVPIDEFEKCKGLLFNLDVSAFKVVKK